MDISHLGPTPSRKRWILALYLDFLAFNTLVGLFQHFLLPKEVPAYTWIPIFLILDYAISKKTETFGQWALSIRHYKHLDPDTGITTRIPYVRKAVKAQENYFTMYCGVFAILDGCKALVRWTEEFVPFPLFGMELSESQFLGYQVLIGLFMVFAGIQILKLTAKGLYFGFSIFAFVIIVAGFQGEQLTRWTIKKQEIRRENWGLQSKQVEYEKIAHFMPQIAMGVSAIPLTLLFLYRRRFNLDEEVRATEFSVSETGEG